MHIADLPASLQKARLADNGCWEWQGSLWGKTGRPRYSLNSKWRCSFRAAYAALKGPIPDGLTLDHLCENRICINPAHLEPVTRAENARRYHANHPYTGKGPLDRRYGSLCKLTDEQIAEIRTSSETALSIGARFGVTRQHVYNIRNGRRATKRAVVA